MFVGNEKLVAKNKFKKKILKKNKKQNEILINVLIMDQHMSSGEIIFEYPNYNWNYIEKYIEPYQKKTIEILSNSG